MRSKQWIKKIPPVSAIALIGLVSLFCSSSGLLLSPISQDYQVNIALVGLIPAMISGGEFIAYILGGFWKRRIVGHREMTSHFVLLMLTVLGISLRPPFPVLCLLFGMQGLLVGLVNFTTNTVVAASFEQERSRYISILYISMGIGAALCPYYPTLQLDRGIYWGNIYRHYFIYVLIVSVSILAVVSVYFKQFGDIVCGMKTVSQSENAIYFLKNKGRGRLVLLCLTALMYQGHQIALCSWLPSYMTQWLKLDSVYAGTALSLFSVGLLISRMIAAMLSTRFTPKQMVVSGCLAGAILLGSGLLSKNAMILTCACALAGVVTGWMLPMIISCGYDYFPENAVAVASTVSTASALGGMGFSWIVGCIAEKSYPAAISLTAVNLIIAAVLMMLLKDGIKNNGGLDHD